jgi:hypothetical protein
MIKLEEFDGHIVLYCKGWYFQKKVDIDFLVGLRRIWAIRCGYDYEEDDKSIDQYIANRLYKIILETNPNIDLIDFQIRLHNEMAKDYLSTYQGLNTIEKLIKFYRSELLCLTIVENKKVLIDLPKVKKRVFFKIIKGKGEYNDYKLITS